MKEAAVLEDEYDRLVDFVSTLKIANDYYCFSTLRQNNSRYLCIQLEGKHILSKELTKIY